jgi:hypothetical protein
MFAQAGGRVKQEWFFRLNSAADEGQAINCDRRIFILTV